ncbi:Hsp20/alpha crystallin family protein [Halopiger thermotolerans]
MNEDFELYEEDDEFVLTVELPGFERDEIDVRWHDDRLRITAEHTDEEGREERQYAQTFSFPKDVDEDEIDATYRNGILEVRLPVVGSHAGRGRTIEVTGE